MPPTHPTLTVLSPHKLDGAERKTYTTLDTILITPDLVSKWRLPPFQRPLKVNEKVRALATQIRADGGVIPGVLTLGVLPGPGNIYLIDGQHRIHAFILSEVKEGYCDVRRHLFDDMAQMGEEFVHLNSQLVRMRPDDILRGLEGSNERLQLIRKKCPFVGYDQIRRGPASPMLSMSTLIRCWRAGTMEVPTSAGHSAIVATNELTDQDATQIVHFLGMAIDAWGKDEEYQRLWGALNLTLCIWLYRRTVINPYSVKIRKLNTEEFKKCLMALSADPNYVDYLLGRGLRDKDRSPCYHRIKTIFTRRLEVDLSVKVYMPSPAWAHGGGQSTRAKRGE